MLKICNDILLITVLSKVNVRACAQVHCWPSASIGVAPPRVDSNVQRERRRGGSAAALGAGRRYVAVWSHGVSHDTDALKCWLRAPAHAHRLVMRCAYRSHSMLMPVIEYNFGDFSVMPKLSGVRYRSSIGRVAMLTDITIAIF